MLKEPIQIALIDDHKLFRSGMAALVANFKKYNILFEAANGLELIDTISKGIIPDIILLDISMPVMDGVEATQILKVKYPKVKIIILSMFEDAEKVLLMVKMGVKGYLLKDSEPHEVEDALLKVSQGELYYPEFVTRHLITNFNSKLENIKLNPREIEFLRFTGTELTYKEIAEAMNISVRTVDSYRDQLFEKLQIKSRVGLVLYSIKNKLIEL
ncbi:response regulator transcription factor [Mucilaginibacter sp. SMC90]|uniref:response regulator transcription factor n=1 Tax=Mucilaginibacter sp. SMC90 TaxID=2929803 RepID=UPI001FB23FA3|nr:response regulator transcription factor [Mucilaginibacter sp. SMC90]UOE49653.1 response regulator transcription factor [Mucilaginibacter sp. SMC90]